MNEIPQQTLRQRGKFDCDQLAQKNVPILSCKSSDQIYKLELDEENNAILHIPIPKSLKD
ncbi:MAG: hypothetical protein ABFC94_16805 [Syntrophomonas sp.]